MVNQLSPAATVTCMLYCSCAVLTHRASTAMTDSTQAFKGRLHTLCQTALSLLEKTAAISDEVRLDPNRPPQPPQDAAGIVQCKADLRMQSVLVDDHLQDMTVTAMLGDRKSWE